MPKATILPIKYVFLDIEGYTKGRISDDQAEIIRDLNEIVRASIQATNIEPKSRILLPSGDGMCIALRSENLPYDIDISLALEILRKINTHNEVTTDAARRFEVRIGLNQDDDILIEDINGKESVAGNGIKMAERIMSQGDGGHLLVSGPVHLRLKSHRPYSGFFQEYEFTTKHDEKHKVFQYMAPNQPGLNTEKLAALGKSRPRLPKLKLFDLSKYGNLYMSGFDLAMTTAFLVDNHEPNKRMFDGFNGAKHHLSQIRVKNKALKERFDQLNEHAQRMPDSEWTPERRRELARNVEAFARGLGDMIANTQSGYLSHPKQKGQRRK